MEVTPLPEPRDIDWGELETLDQERGEKSDRFGLSPKEKMQDPKGYHQIIPTR
jgi:hypothetical protein